MKAEELAGKRILIHALVNLGDVVLATSAAALLKQLCPTVHITMMVRHFAREIVANNPVIDDYIIFNYKSKQKSLSATWEMVKQLRRGKFDVCISLDIKLRPALLTFLAGIPCRVVPERVFDDAPSNVVKLYTDVIPMTRDFLKTPQAENFQTTIRGWLHVEDVHAKPVIGIPTEQNIQKAEELYKRLQPGKKHVALCVKGSFPLKTWPKEYFCVLMEKLQQRYDADFFIIGAGFDREYADEVIQSSYQPHGSGRSVQAGLFIRDGGYRRAAYRLHHQRAHRGHVRLRALQTVAADDGQFPYRHNQRGLQSLPCGGGRLSLQPAAQMPVEHHTGYGDASL